MTDFDTRSYSTPKALPPVASDMTLFGADALPPERFEWPVFEEAPVDRTCVLSFMEDQDRFGGLD